MLNDAANLPFLPFPHVPFSKRLLSWQTLLILGKILQWSDVIAVYIDPKGLLNYTPPEGVMAVDSFFGIHTIPDGSITTGLVVNNTRNMLMNKYYNWHMCNTALAPKVWRVWVEFRDAYGKILNNGATGDNKCHRVNLMAKDVEGYGSYMYGLGHDLPERVKIKQPEEPFESIEDGH